MFNLNKSSYGLQCEGPFLWFLFLATNTGCWTSVHLLRKVNIGITAPHYFPSFEVFSYQNSGQRKQILRHAGTWVTKTNPLKSRLQEHFFYCSVGNCSLAYRKSQAMEREPKETQGVAGVAPVPSPFLACLHAIQYNPREYKKHTPTDTRTVFFLQADSSSNAAGPGNPGTWPRGATVGVRHLCTDSPVRSLCTDIYRYKYIHIHIYTYIYNA